ncbi:dihydrolipoyl dehydrogenase family protein [Halobacillus sp. MO56]
MNTTYDVIVIGTGVAGSTVATKAQKAGLEVAIVDERQYGGTCPQRGCDPKKVMAGISKIVDDAKRVKGLGLDGDVTLNWKDLQAFKKKFTEPIPEGTEEKFNSLGIRRYHGTASFLDPHTLKIGEHNVTAKYIVIATGAKPADLPFEGFEHLVTSEQFLEMEELPDRLLFVGGGYISFEFAQLAARLGKDVIIVHRGRNVLENHDFEMTNKLIEHTKDLGVEIHTSTEVTKVTKLDSGYKIDVKKFNHEHALKADMVFHGAGRAPNIDHLELANAGIEFSKQGIKVNENQQSKPHQHIYAAGDCADTGLPPLTPSAGEEGTRLVSHMLDDETMAPEQKPVPSIVFTYPALASVGLSQQEAREKNIPYESESKTITKFFTYQRTKEPGAYVKILLNPATGEILGAHFLSSEAEHLVNIFTLAIQKGLTKHDLKSVLWGYPTAESDIPSFF